MLVSLVAFAVLPKHGAFLLEGGGTITPDMLNAFAELCGGKDKKIVVLAQSLFDAKWGTESKKILESAKFTNVVIESRNTLSDSDLVSLERKLDGAAGIWVPEGEESIFFRRLNLPWCQKVFPKMIAKGVNWFGTGVGAKIVGTTVVTKSLDNPEGIGLIDGIVETKYFVDHRELQLRKAFFGCRVQYGFGLDPGEWIILRDNLIEKKVGSPQVFLRE